MVRHVRAVGPAVPYWDLVPVTTPTPTPHAAVHLLTLIGTVHIFGSEFLHTNTVHISVFTASAMPWHPDVQVFASDVALGAQVTLNKPDLWSLVLHGASPVA